jgi:hypothetical protein
VGQPAVQVLVDGEFGRVKEEAVAAAGQGVGQGGLGLGAGGVAAQGLEAARAVGARYHLSNRQMSDAITVMEQAGMIRPVPVPAFPRPATYGASTEYDTWLDPTDRGDPIQPSPALAAYLDARDRHLQAN